MGSYNDLQTKPAAPAAAGGTYRKLDMAGRGKRGAMDDVAGAVSTVIRSIPFADEINDTLYAKARTGADLVTGKVRPKSPGEVKKLERKHFDEAQARGKAYADDFKAHRPRVGAVTEGVGIAAQALPALLTGGSTLAAPAVAEAAPIATGLMGALQKVGQIASKVPVVGRLPGEAMLKGGVTGGLSGALAALGGEGTAAERVEDMRDAVVPSAVVGAGIPALAVGGFGLAGALKQMSRPAEERAAAQAGRVLSRRAPGAFDLDAVSPEDIRMPFERMGPGGETVARAVASVPGPGQDIARSTLAARRTGARSRVLSALRRDLGDDGSSFHGLKDALDKRRLTDSEPLYREAYDRPAPIDDGLERLKSRPSIRKAMSRGARLAHEAGEDPFELGLYHIEDPADWASTMPPSRGAEIERAMSRTAPRSPSRGKSLAKFIADQGGIRDRGDVQAMGGGEWHKGRAYQRGLIGDGADADEWALRAWEAGYFPGHQTRPTANELLDAVGEEIRGRPRYAREADPRVVDRMRQFDEAEEMNYRGGPADDLPDPDSYGGRPEPREGPVEGEAMTWKAWDYAKRGLDDELEALRDPVTGKLPRTDEVRLIEQTRKELRRRLTDLNPRYREALAAYTGPSRQMNAMDMGRRMVTGKADPEQLAEGMELMGQDELEAMRMGVSRGLSDVFRARNPQVAFRRFMDDDIIQERLRLGFSNDEGYGRFMRDIADEFEAQLSYNRILTGSRTTPLAEDIAAVNDAAGGEDFVGAGLKAAADGRNLRTRAFDWAATKLRQAREMSTGLNNPEVSRLLGQALFRAGNPADLVRAMERAQVLSPEEVRAILPALSSGFGAGAVPR